MPSLLNVNDDMSVSILIMDVLIKQVGITVLEKTSKYSINITHFEVTVVHLT